MTAADVKRLALVLSIQAEIEGMKLSNWTRQQFGHVTFDYMDADFQRKAEELRIAASKHDDEL